jgi:cell division protein FtsI (penicillin-binding protein 3)
VMLVGVLLVGRAVQLSVFDGERLQALAAIQETAAPVEEQRRGTIYSTDGNQLAMSLDTITLVATPYQVSEPEEAARQLAGILRPETGMSEAEILERLTSRDGAGSLRGYSVVAEDLDPALAGRIQELAISGLTFQPDYRRFYPNGDLASQLIGYLGDYGSTYGGVEAGYDEQLREGDVHLTLDTAVQEELEIALRETMDEYEARSALGLVMRVDDGSIVAMSNMPDYDNNEFPEASPELQRNRVLTDPYEPGSTFKAFTIAAALEEGAVTEDQRFIVPDRIQVADRIVYDSEPHDTEQMNPAQILQESSNVGTIKIAQSLGGELLCNYISHFGFGEPTGIDLAGEDPGNVPPYETWSGVSIGNIPIGQGLTTTPIQIAAGYAAIANGGTRVTPHVVDSGAPATAGERVISEETSAILRGMLQDVVDGGTGRHATIPGYTVAGKTGTAQKVDPEEGTYGDEYVTSFIGFAPASDPEYLTLIVVDEPQKSIWGEQVAAPAFQQVMSFTLRYFNVVPDRVPVADQEGDA